MNKKRKTKKTKLKNKKEKTIWKLDFPENDKAKLHILYIYYFYISVINFFHFLYIDLIKRGESFQAIL